MNLARTHLTCASSHFALLYTFTCGLWIGRNFFVCAGFSATKTAQSLCGFGPERLKTNLSICYLICRLCICLYLSTMSDSDDGTWHGVIAQVNSEAKHYFTPSTSFHTLRGQRGAFSHRLTSSLYKMKASISHFLIGHLLWREVQALRKTLIHFDWILQEHNHLHLRSR